MASHLNQTTTEAEARLIREVGDVGVAGSKLIRGWPWVAGNAASGETVQSLMATLRAVSSYTDPKANSKTYTGTYANSEVESRDETEFGTGERAPAIIQTLTKVDAVTAFASLSGLSPLISQENEILEPFGYGAGEGDVVAYRYVNISTGSQAACMAISDANLASIPGAGWTYVDRKFEEQTDNTAVFTVLLRKVAWNAFDYDDPDFR